MKTVKEVFEYEYTPQIIQTDGLFINFGQFDAFPSAIQTPENETLLDKMYFARSNNKYVSPLISNMVEAGFTKSQITNHVVKMAKIKYGERWARLFATYNLEYDPIENYNSTERMTNDLTTITYGKRQTVENDLTHTKTGTETDVVDLEHTKTGTETDDVDNTHTKTGTETEAVDNEHTKTGTETDEIDNTHTKTGTEADNGSNSSTRTPNLSKSDKTNVFGFNTPNSGNGHPRENDVITETGTETNTGTDTNTKTFNTSDVDDGETTKTYNVTDTDDGETTKTYNVTDTDDGGSTKTYDVSDVDDGETTKTYNVTDTDDGTTTSVDSGSDSHSRSYTLTREGNIGVTTSQQMLQSEIDLWSIWEIFEDVIFPDMDKLITLPIY